MLQTDGHVKLLSEVQALSINGLSCMPELGDGCGINSGSSKSCELIGISWEKKNSKLFHLCYNSTKETQLNIQQNVVFPANYASTCCNFLFHLSTGI